MVTEQLEMNFFLLVTSLKNLFLFNPWLHPIFDKRTLKPTNIPNSPENFNTITPTIKENFNSKFTVSNIVGHPVITPVSNISIRH